MPAHPAFTSGQLQALCDVLGDTVAGLTGSEIGRLLSACGIADPNPSLSKRLRLFEALQARQAQDRCGNAVLDLIQRAMAPVSYRDRTGVFDTRRYAMNEILAFAGMQLGEDGELRASEKATTLSQAQERAGHLRNELRRRAVHSDVLQFCRVELLQKNYFHAVLEATKSVAEKIRRKSGLLGDGESLVEAAFGKGSGPYPLLAFNTLQTASEQMEHAGLIKLLKGAIGTFRNPTAHAPKISWVVNERDALETLTLLSMLHRRLDEATPTRPSGQQP
ncbi:MAG: TIGR02391 family protein [Alphaproteobacteria bacterium]|nr:TIGR02391 family protein [Alphaproteobacteria bacterium]